jgi:hypothetical protein
MESGGVESKAGTVGHSLNLISVSVCRREAHHLRKPTAGGYLLDTFSAKLAT